MKYTTYYNIKVKTDTYSMPLYEYTNMSIKQVEEYLKEKNCLEPEDYELIVDEVELDDGYYNYSDYPESCIENC